MCQNFTCSPLYRDWTEKYGDDWVPIKTEAEAWNWFQDNILNLPDGTGRAAKDIAKAQTLGGGNYEGVDRIERIGGEEILRHQHRRNHINYASVGLEWRKATSVPGNKYINPATG